MADLFRNLAAAAAAFAAAQPVLGQPAAPDGFALAAESIVYDGGTSRVDFRGLELTQGDVVIAAGEATSSAFDGQRSEWHLRGGVRITVGAVGIAAEEASFSMLNNELTTLELRGAPATFADPGSGGSEPVEGGAERLVYDHAEQKLNLMGNAWITIGPNEVTGCDLIYDIDDINFKSGSTDCDEPFRYRATRPEDDASAAEPTASP